MQQSSDVHQAAPGGDVPAQGSVHSALSTSSVPSALTVDAPLANAPLAEGSGRMNPEIKGRWVAALRSGKYQQTKSALRDSHGFCCLGVLCDVLNPEGWGGVDEEVDVSGMAHDHSYGVPSWDVARQAGLESPMGFEVEIANNRQWLTVHNDQGATFAQIADAIEEQL